MKSKFKEMKKLNKYRAGLYMTLHYKEIDSELRLLMRKHNFAGALQAVVNHLRALSAAGHVDKLCHHIQFLGTVYCRGNRYVRYLLENLFVRSLVGIKRIYSTEEWQAIEHRLPPSFVQIHIMQQR